MTCRLRYDRVGLGCREYASDGAQAVLDARMGWPACHGANQRVARVEEEVFGIRLEPGAQEEPFGLQARVPFADGGNGGAARESHEESPPRLVDGPAHLEPKPLVEALRRDVVGKYGERNAADPGIRE